MRKGGTLSPLERVDFGSKKPLAKMLKEAERIIEYIPRHIPRHPACIMILCILSTYNLLCIWWMTWGCSGPDNLSAQEHAGQLQAARLSSRAEWSPWI